VVSGVTHLNNKANFSMFDFYFSMFGLERDV
jgi:hypothetical protein